MSERIKYVFAFLGIVFIEVIIALYIHDKIIRPYIGDVLVVFAVYYLVKIFVPKRHILLPVYVFLFAVIVEMLQYVRIVEILGLQDNSFFKVLIGSVFDWKDIACYAAGCIILEIWEITRLHKQMKGA